jgi:hypothetical protein
MAKGNNRYLEAIRILRQFESKALLEEKYARLHDSRNISAQKLNSIVLSMRQGREFFESAETSDYLTRPIEQYYGISAYSRATTLLLDLHMNEDALEQSHGLSIKAFPKRIEKGESLLSIAVKFGNGVFSQWAEVSQRRFVMRVDSTKPGLTNSYTVPKTGSSLELGQALSLIPEVWNELHQITKKHYVALSLNPAGSDFSKNIWAFDGKTSQPVVSECFPVVANDKIQHLNNLNWRVGAEAWPDFEPQLVQQNEDGFNIGSALLVPPVADIRLSPLAVYFVSAYVLSMLARYRPSIWGGIWNLGAGDEAYPLA